MTDMSLRDTPKNTARPRGVFLSIPTLLWAVVIGLMFANIRGFNHSPLAFRVICLSTLFASPLIAAYTIFILILFIRRRSVWGIAFASLLLIPLAAASVVAIGWLIHGVPLQT